MTGVQTLVPIMLDHVNAGQPLLRLSISPGLSARLFGIAAKGRIAVGYDADLTVVDLKRRQTITGPLDCLRRWIARRRQRDRLARWHPDPWP